MAGIDNAPARAMATSWRRAAFALLLTTLLIIASACDEDAGADDDGNIDDQPTVEIGTAGDDEDENTTDNQNGDIPSLYEVITAESEDGEQTVNAVVYGQQPVAHMDALLEGTLALNGTCLGVTSEFEDGFIHVVWPYEYGVVFEDGTVALLDENGDIVAREGDPVSMGGGNSPDPEGQLAEIAPEDCVAEGYWMSADEVRIQEPGDDTVSVDDEERTEPHVQTEEEAREHDAQQYADAFDVDLDEAIWRMEMQGRLQDEPAALEQGEVDRFGGIFWEHEPEYRLVVLMTDGDEEAVRAHFDDPELLEILDVRTVEYSQAELYEVQNEVHDLLTELGVRVSSGTNIQENHVEIYVADASIVEDALASAGETLPDNVVIVEEEEAQTLD